MAVDFTKMLDQKPEDIKEPPRAPVGTYEFVGISYSEESLATEKFDGVKHEFVLRLTAPLDDVNPDDFADFKKEGGSLNNQMVRKAFLLSRASVEDAANGLFQLKTFLFDHCLLDAGMTVREALANFKGAKGVVQVKHREYQGRQFLDAGKTGPL